MRRLGPLGRILVVWLVTSAIAMTLVAVFLAPHLPPGSGSKEAAGQQLDNEVLTLVSVFVVAGVFTYLGYALIAFRERGDSDGPPIRGNGRAQTIWVVGTTVIVLFLAAFGTYQLLGGAGGGQGAEPVFVPAHSGQSPLQVQVIAQQWQFTYRYPTEGDFESAHLVLPVDRQIELHVTSLDVIHSFWVPALGLKADANPGADNIAYVTPEKLGNVQIHCAELCGLFHGYMFGSGSIVTPSAFASWVAAERRFVAPVTHYLPAYSTTYLPDPSFRAG